MKTIIYLLAVLITAPFCQNANAQLSTNEKNRTIDSLVKQLNNRYIFPEGAKKIETFIRKKQKSNGYSSFEKGNDFADELTRDLQNLSNDKHLNLYFSPEEMPFNNHLDMMDLPDSLKPYENESLLSKNYGIRKLDVLKGNIGYIDFEFFCGPEYAGQVYTSALNYLAHTEALIIDLRQSNGSMSADAIPLIMSYFFDKPTHITDLYWRKGNVTNQYWTYATVPGPKYLNKPIYVLTSGKTFSGAEGFAYDLKNLKRATIIGETTGGGANGGGSVTLTPHFGVFIPIGRAINPITKTNWEGVGVIPDTIISPRLALYKAQKLALQAIIESSANRPEKLAFLNDLVKALENEKPVYKTVTFKLNKFTNAKEVYVAGSFNFWSHKTNKMILKNNEWVAEVETEPGKIVYKFVVDGRWITDPDNPNTLKEDENINSLIEVN